MQYSDIFTGSMLINSLNQFKSDNMILNFFITILTFVIINSCTNQNISNLFEYLFNKVNLFGNNKFNKISFVSKREYQSDRTRALLFFLTNNCSKKNITELIEDSIDPYDYWNSKKNEDIYRVNQDTEFNFTDDIKGKASVKEKEETGYNGKVTYRQMVNLEVYSNTLKLDDIQKFVEDCSKEYKKYLKTNSLRSQSIIIVESSKKKDDDKPPLSIINREWYSFKTFDNTFFPEKKEFLNVLNNFLENKSWYEKKGLPWTLGIMLSGHPGCGKTSFIKALLNYTNRHCIDIKLDEDFDFSDLERLLYDDEISGEIIVPVNKRIIVLEDIDAMGDVVKDRELIDKENEKINEELSLLESSKLMQYKGLGSLDSIKCKNSQLFSEECSNEIKLGNHSNIFSKINKNNLSKLLNIFDGLTENPGRIIIVTTNRPEVIDKAFKRPGRIDIHLHFGKCKIKELIEIINDYWETEIQKDSILEIKLKDKSFDEKYTPAEVINFCRKSKNLEETIDAIHSN